MDWDDDLDDYEYQQASMEMSDPDDAPYCNANFFAEEQDAREKRYIDEDYEMYRREMADREKEKEEAENALKRKYIDYHYSHDFLPVLIQMEERTIDPIIKKRYSEAIIKFQAKHDEPWYLGSSTDAPNSSAFYCKSSTSIEWMDQKGGCHLNSNFLYVDISYYKELDPRLFILCYRYFIDTYSFVEWYQQLSSTQLLYVNEHLKDFDLTDIQALIIKDDFAPPSDDNIEDILMEKSPDLAVHEYWEFEDGYEEFESFPMAGIVFKKFNQTDFDQINLYKLKNETYACLLENYGEKLSEKKLSESKIRDNLTKILNFDARSLRFELSDSEDTAIKYLLQNEENCRPILRQLMKNKGNDPNLLDDLIEKIKKFYDYYLWYEQNVSGKWRSSGYPYYHQWGLSEAFNATGGKKLKYSLEDNVLSFEYDS